MDIGSLYSDYLKSTTTSASNLERTLSGTKQKSDDELLDACKQFETYFYEQVFKGMEKAMVPKSDSDANDTLVDYYKEQLISKYSEQVVDQSGDNSLANQLYKQMKRNNAIPDANETDAATLMASANALSSDEDTSIEEESETSIDGVSQV